MREASNVPENIKFAIYLSVVGVVILEEPVDEFSDQTSQESPEAFGVDKILDYIDPQMAEEAEVSDYVESGSEELKESFL